MNSTQDDHSSIFNSIIVNFKQESYTFEKNTYNRKLLASLISEEDYEEIIKKCSNIIGFCLIKKKNNDTITFSRLIIFLMVISMGLLIAYFVTLSQSFQANAEVNEVTFGICIFTVICSIVISSFLSIYNYFKPMRKFQPLSYFIKRDINEYLDKINEEYKGIVFFQLFDSGSEVGRKIEVKPLIK